MYILNVIPTSNLEMMNPSYEAWYEMKSNVNHFKVFGYLAYAHVVDKLKKILDRKSEACIFFGYGESSKSYRLYNLKIHKLMVSRYMNFDEG